MFAGLMPMEIEQLHPSLWVDEEEEGALCRNAGDHECDAAEFFNNRDTGKTFDGFFYVDARMLGFASLQKAGRR